LLLGKEKENLYWRDIMFESVYAYMSKYGDKIGAVVRDIRSGEKVCVNPDKQFAAASVIKLPVMWEFYRKVAAREIDVHEKFVLHDSNKVGSSVYDFGILREMHDGLELTYKDILTLMIIISDDTATNILLDMLNMDNITKTVREIGMKNTIVQRRMHDYEKVLVGIDNRTTAGDMDQILHVILQGGHLPFEYHEAMLEVMAKQQVNTAIPLYLSPKLKIAHKTGSILDFGLEHDVGIIYDEKDIPAVAISILTKGLDDNRVVMGKIAKMAFDEIKQKYL